MGTRQMSLLQFQTATKSADVLGNQQIFIPSKP
jgi:hypothetical protein